MHHANHTIHLFSGIAPGDCCFRGTGATLRLSQYLCRPTPYVGNFRNTVTYTAPYNAGSVTTGVYPTPYGYNAYSTTTTVIQPVYSGPYHSIIWDPTTLTYKYVGGTTNTPNYNYSIPSPYNPYLPY